MYSRTAKFQTLYEQLLNSPYVSPPPPWRKTVELEKECILGAGFVDEGSRLILLYEDGRELLDCMTGNTITLDDTPFEQDCDWWDARDLAISGIGPASGRWIRLACAFGGGYHRVGYMNWMVIVVNLFWPHTDVLLLPPYSNGLDGALKIFRATTMLLGCGFSPDGESLAVVARDQLLVYRTVEGRYEGSRDGEGMGDEKRSGVVSPDAGWAS